jgi:hypothetical protein
MTQNINQPPQLDGLPNSHLLVRTASFSTSQTAATVRHCTPAYSIGLHFELGKNSPYVELSREQRRLASPFAAYLSGVSQTRNIYIRKQQLTLLSRLPCRNTKVSSQFEKPDYLPKRGIGMQLQIMIAISNMHTRYREP